ncbi:MAG TPA: response regulator, partial [Herpetosiphonaceae bacterium]
TAADGSAGLDLARELQPDVIILDLLLPAVNGERVAFVLAEDPETKHVPIVIYTALDPGHRGALDPRLRVIHKEEALDHLPALLDELIAERQRPPCAQILVIEDDPGLQQLIIRGLEGEGYALTGALTGEDGLRLAQRQPFDLILLDVMLPDVSGLDVLRQLRALNQTATTPTMLISVLNSPEERARGLQLGADDYLSKPFDWQELAARVQASLRRRELEGSANPSTMLPGNKAIERAITSRIDMGLPFAVGYSDLDNFKAYNDRYGFLKGDAMIHQTARIIMAAVEQHGQPGDFVGHIGGDDFVFVSHPASIAAICEAIIAEFDQLAPLYYDLEARRRGAIEQLDRQGRPTTFPLVSISIGVVSSLNQPITHFAQVGDIAAELKKRAKARPGSVYIIAGAEQEQAGGGRPE